MKNTKSFQERFNRWKNGETYWDIVGKPLRELKPEELTIDQAERDYLDSVVSLYERGKDSVILNTISYNQWRESLPDNLKKETSDYDLYGAYKAGMEPRLENDGYYHLGSRDPKTGKILKLSQHPTYLKALNEDAKLGYFPIKSKNRYTYTDTWKGNNPGYAKYDTGKINNKLHDTQEYKSKLFKTIASTIIPEPIKLNLRLNAYNNISPNRYTNFSERAVKGILLNLDVDNLSIIGYDPDRDDLMAQWLQIPENLRHNFPGRRKLILSDIWPKNADPNLYSFQLPLTQEETENLINEAKTNNLSFGLNMNSKVLDRLFGDHTVGRGVDKKRGEYISYYDKYDINPFEGADAQKTTNNKILDYIAKQTDGDIAGILGAKPFHIYNRTYLDDYYGVNSGAKNGDYYGGYLPEVVIKPRKQTSLKKNSKNKH